MALDPLPSAHRPAVLRPSPPDPRPTVLAGPAPVAVQLGSGIGVNGFFVDRHWGTRRRRLALAGKAGVAAVTYRSGVTVTVAIPLPRANCTSRGLCCSLPDGLGWEPAQHDFDAGVERLSALRILR